MVIKQINTIIGAVVVAFVAFGTFEAYDAAQHKAPKPKKAEILNAAPQLEALNNYRRDIRLHPLQRDKELERRALETALENAKNGRLQHGRLYGGSKCEIIAENYSGFEFALLQWEKSDAGHREAIRSRKFKRAGCACVKKNGRFFCCVQFQ